MAKESDFLRALESAFEKLVKKPPGSFKERKEAFRRYLVGEVYATAGVEPPREESEEKKVPSVEPGIPERKSPWRDMPMLASHERASSGGTTDKGEEIHAKAMSAAARWKAKLEQAARKERRGGDPTGDKTMHVVAEKKTPAGGNGAKNKLLRTAGKLLSKEQVAAGRSRMEARTAGVRPTMGGPVMVSDATRAATGSYPEGYDEKRWKRRKFAMR